MPAALVSLSDLHDPSFGSCFIFNDQKSFGQAMSGQHYRTCGNPEPRSAGVAKVMDLLAGARKSLNVR